jgi:acyl transferase domain-containing protein
MNKAVILALLLTVALVACQQHVSVAGNHTIIEETSRLASIAAKGELKADDLDQLEMMVAGDETAEHELEEVRKFAGYGEQVHALHALAGIAAYLESGKETICPGHELAHYYVFTKHGDDHDAEHALEEAEETLSEWAPLAQAYDKEFPGPDSFEVVQQRIKDHLERIENGDSTATDEEIIALATRSICIEGE